MRFPRQNDSHSAKVPAALVGLALLLALAVCELAASGRAYRSTIAAEDWRQIAAQLREAPKSGSSQMMVVARPWLQVEARRELNPWYTPEDSTTPNKPQWLNGLAAPDFSGVQTLWLLAPAGERNLPSWLRNALADEGIRGLGIQRSGPAFKAGGLRLQRYELQTGRTQEASFAEILNHKDVEIRSSGGPCRSVGSSQGSRWRCPDGVLRLRYTEFDHRPRRCLEVELPEGTQLQLNWPLQPAPGTRSLRGHLGFSDFNARLRSSAPVKLSLQSQGGEQRLARLFSNTDSKGQSWQAFELELGPDKDSAELRLTTTLPGQFQRGLYNPRAKRLPCFELRQFSSSGPAPAAKEESQP